MLKLYQSIAEYSGKTCRKVKSLSKFKVVSFLALPHEAFLQFKCAFVLVKCKILLTSSITKHFNTVKFYHLLAKFLLSLSVKHSDPLKNMLKYM